MPTVVSVADCTAFVKRSDILRAYMLHVIQTAEHQFKCRFKNLHISSPVKLKTQFLDGEEYKALVIDCGGGTTDLSSC